MTRLARAQVPEPGGQEQDAGADQVAGPPVENPVRHHWYAWKVALVLPSQPTTEPMVTRRRSHVPATERAVMNVTVAVASESGMCCCAFSPARRAGARPSSAEACGPAGRDVEDLVSSGSTLNLLIELVEQLGAQVVGVGCPWRRTSIEVDGKPVFSLVSRELSYL